VPKHIKAHKVL